MVLTPIQTVSPIAKPTPAMIHQENWTAILNPLTNADQTILDTFTIHFQILTANDAMANPAFFKACQMKASFFPSQTMPFQTHLKNLAN